MCLAVPGRLTDAWDVGGMPMGRVSFGSATTDVCLACVPDLRVGDYTVVHAGFALRRLDETSALEILETFSRIDDSATRGPVDSGPRA